MSRSGYVDHDWGDDGNWGYIRDRGALLSAIRGKRGQKLLRDMIDALDAMPEKRLVAEVLEFQGWSGWLAPDPDEDIIIGGDQLVTGRGEVVRIGDVCAFGALGRMRGLDLDNIDPQAPDDVAEEFGIATALARHIVYINDEDGPYNRTETPEERWVRVRAWVEAQIIVK